MKRKLASRFPTVVILLIIFLLGLSIPEQIAGMPEFTESQLAKIYNTDNYKNDFAPGEVLVGMKSDVVSSPAKSAAVFPQLNIVSIENLYQSVSGSLGISSTASTASDQDSRTVYLVKLALKTRESVLDAIEILKQNPNVAYAEPNYINHPAVVPNDPSYSMLWGMPKIQASQAWDISKGSNSVKIGILDSGFDYGHPDLAANIDRSLAYYPAMNTYGYSADIGDYVSGHGTHVAGIVGAVGNNGIGVVGVNWNVSIVPIKIALSNDSANAYASDMAKAVKYATELGLPVINMSYSLSQSQVLIDAVGAYKGLFIVAAGNVTENDNNRNNDTKSMQPTLHSLGNVIFVANSQSTDSLSSSSFYGVNTVALAAPGNSIYSTYPRSLGGGTGYATMSGTSMATPYVSGTAGLLLSYAPNLTMPQLKAAILNNVDVISGLSSYVSTSGRLNVYKAISSLVTGGTGVAFADVMAWLVRVEGTVYDQDGVYGSQAVDLIRGYYIEVFGVPAVSGNPADYISNQLPAGFHRYAKADIPGGALRPGDIVVWGTEHGGGYGNIAIVIEVNATNYVIMQANQALNLPNNYTDSVKRVARADHDYWGIIRPTIYGSGGGNERVITFQATSGAILTQAMVNEQLKTAGVGASDAFSAAFSSNVSGIGANAFSGCEGLTSVIIPDTVTSLNNNAFASCVNLTSLTIPSRLTMSSEAGLGYNVFWGSKNLAEVIIFPSTDTSQRSIGANAFYNSNTYSWPSITKVTIKDGITGIGNYAFQQCTGLTAMIIPDSVVSIGVNAFQGCSHLSEVYFDGDAPGSVGTNAFSSVASGAVALVYPDAKGFPIEGALWNGMIIRYRDSDVQKVDAPTANLTAGLYGPGTTVALSTTTQDAQIYYTTDGTVPTAESTLYSAPIMLKGCVTIKAIAVKAGLENSEVAEFKYIVIGDINGDGSITMADVTLTYRHVRGLEELTGDSFLAADVNKDGRITMADVALIYQHVRGKINSFE